MAAQKIGFANKQSGSLWTSSNANEVKDVVNSHADNIDSLSGSLATARQDIVTMQTAMQEKVSSADMEAALSGKADITDVEAALAGKADSADVEAALAQKVDTTDMEAALEGKADASDVEAALAAKANASDVTTALGLKADKTERIQMTDTTARIDPNKLYVWGSVNNLNLTLRAGSEEEANEYKLEFTTNRGFRLTLNQEVRWVEEPEWEDGWTYQVSIEDGLAVCAGWEALSNE